MSDAPVYLRLNLWDSGRPIWWPADDVGPMLVLSPEQARQQQPGPDAPPNVPATVLRQKGGGTHSEWVRQSPVQILDMLTAAVRNAYEHHPSGEPAEDLDTTAIDRSGPRHLSAVRPADVGCEGGEVEPGGAP